MARLARTRLLLDQGHDVTGLFRGDMSPKYKVGLGAACPLPQPSRPAPMAHGFWMLVMWFDIALICHIQSNQAGAHAQENCPVFSGN